YSYILLDNDWEILIIAKIEVICNKFKKKFKIDYLDAINFLRKAKFTLYDIAVSRNIIDFV
ncbi:hypothetical protein B0T20DRAFT_349239, partial [Sordaria brevicollis]